MTPLVEYLHHPSSFSAIGALAPDERLRLAFAILIAAGLLAGLAGLISARWARAHAVSSGATGGLRGRGIIGGIGRDLVALTAFVGVYLAVEVAPLGGRLERGLSGTTFVLGAWFAARLVTHVSLFLLMTSIARVHGQEHERLEREYLPLARKGVTLGVGLVLVSVVLQHFGHNVSSLVAALGVGSLAIGLAAQQTLGNMIAGFTLLVDRPFRPGERIRIATGETGGVVDIGVRSTRIRLDDQSLLIVPNADLVNSRVLNFASQAVPARGQVKITVPYGTDLGPARAALLEVADADERVKKAPAPAVSVSALGELGVELTLGFEARSASEVGAAEEAARRRLLERFAEAAIPIAHRP